jgi:Nif-specific regulatory protein
MDRKQAKTAATAVYRRESIIGHATTLKPVFRLVSRLARTDSTVLILGESGTGKELIARALHFESERAGGQFVPVHLSAISENLIESELFGHLKGAFTGADKDREGAFELGNGGTIFLDEIGEISESVQIKLLRVIQEKEFKPVGGSRFKSTDARIITATNKDLYKLVEEGKFRADLYYRLNVVPIQLPSLQERMRDIPELVGFLVEKISGRIRIPAPAVEDSVIEAFMTHSWPGNVRELENTLENMILLCDRDRLTSGDLPDFLKSRNGESETPVLRGTGKENVLASLERETIQMALMRNNGVLTSTAKYLGTTRRILKYKMDKLGIDKTDLFRN